MTKQQVLGGKAIEADYKPIYVEASSKMSIIKEEPFSLNISPETPVPYEMKPTFSKAEIAY